MLASQRYNYNELAYALSPVAFLDHMGFRPFEWQKWVVNDTGKRVCLLCSRQAGKSTCVSSVPYHSAKYYPKSLNIIIAPNEDQAAEDMIKVKDFIAHDPTAMDLVRDGADLIQLKNGSRIMIVVATDKAARGYSRPRTVLLDEASRMPDIVYKSGVVPMMNNSPDSNLYVLSTPFGQTGFFYEIWKSRKRRRPWTKIFVRTPWDPDPKDPTNLIPARPEEEFKAWCRQEGVIGCYSPNHMDYDDQLSILEDIGMQQYRQEFCCDFVEMNGQVFSNDDLAVLFHNNTPIPAKSNGVGSTSNVLVPKSLGGRFF